jgi:hypothetical protein
MIVRQMKQEDVPQLERIHAAQGFEYSFPKLDDPLYFIKLVGEDDGRIVNAGIAHLTAEIFFLADLSAGSARQRFDNFVTLEREGCRVAYHQGGLSDLHCWLPPEVARPFGRRLMRLGWKRPLWTSFAKDL